MAEELKDTLNLPVTDFPMRAGLAEREPQRMAHWDRLGLYEQIQKRAKVSPRLCCTTDLHSRMATCTLAPR